MCLNRPPPRSTLFPYTTLFRSRPSSASASAAARSASRSTSRTDGRPSSTSALGAVPDSSAARCSRSEEHTSELQSQSHLVCRLLHEKKKNLDIKQKQKGGYNT